MTRPRGRPPATASDIQLLWYVRGWLDRGMTIEQACEEGLKARTLVPAGNPIDQVGALKKRFERVSRKYPDPHAEGILRPGEIGPYWWPIKTKRRIGIGAALLSIKRTKPVK